MSRRAPMKPAVEAALELLCQTFPKAFVRFEQRRRPLKIGIYDDLRIALDGAITDAELKRALRVYCINAVYRSRLVAGALRIDLKGEPAATVSVEHARAPAPKLKPKPKTLKPKALEPAPKPKASLPSVRRMSLRELREAALRRKARQDELSSTGE